MKYNQNHLSLAVRLALGIGFITSAGLVQAQQASSDTSSAAQTETKPAASEAKTLKAVVVTGSLIRRVDAETASPVVTIDRATIANAGNPTLGNVLQQMPAISGNATNTQNNSNGGGVASPLLEGGDGSARISLRGLGVNRTLVLIDGQRMANADVNMIPQNMIERVDVLAEGASTVYGSDAIGGVANFILRKDYKGAEASINGGISGHGDGQRRGFSLTAGATGDNYNIVGGIDYNKYDAVLATKRKYSAHQLYLSSGVAQPAGSSTIPTGKIQTPASIAARTAAGTCPDPVRHAGTRQRIERDRLPLRPRRAGCVQLQRLQLHPDRAAAYRRLRARQLQPGGQPDVLLRRVLQPHPVERPGRAARRLGHSDGWYVSKTTRSIRSASPSAPTRPTRTIRWAAMASNTRLTGARHPPAHLRHQERADQYRLARRVRPAAAGTGMRRSTTAMPIALQRDYNEVNIADFQAAINSGVNIFDQANQTGGVEGRRGHPGVRLSPIPSSRFSSTRTASCGICRPAPCSWPSAACIASGP